MSITRYKKLAIAAPVVIAALAVLEHFVGSAHMRAKLGHQDISGATCFHCHFVSTNNVEWARPKPHHDSPAAVAVSGDGKRLYVALDDRDEVAEVDLTSQKVLRRAKVTGRPFGLALNLTGERLFVACRTADRLTVLETSTLTPAGSIQVGKGPVAVACVKTPLGERVLVANSVSDDVSVIATEPLAEISRPTAGREPFAIAVDNRTQQAFVANRMVTLDAPKSQPKTELTVINPANGHVLRRETIESAHLCEGVCSVPTLSWAVVPLVKVRNLVPITQVANGWVMSSGIAVYDTVHGGSPIQLPTDEANACFADPSAIVADPGGQRAYLASGGSDAVTVIDLQKAKRWLDAADPATRSEAVYDLSLSPEYVLARIPTKRNPKHLALTPDSKTLIITERLEDSILLVNTETLKPCGRIILGDGGSRDPIRRGEKVFTTAAYTFQNQFSCRSCHPDGHVDGLSYDFDGDGIGDNLLDNRSLQGVARTEPLKWNGGNPRLQVQCGPRFAKVLMRTEPFPEQELEDLTAYIKSLPPPRVLRNEGARLNAQQERGRAIFFATREPSGKEIPVGKRCVTCHPPPFYSVRLAFDVGSKAATDSSAKFDTPHLLGVSDTAPYLHDGRAQTLEEIWTIYGTNDVHGVVGYMNKIQLNDLVEFLKTL